MSSKIMKELCDTAEVDQKRGEDGQVFKLRLAVAASELPDSIWGKLSTEAQNWALDAADAANAKKPLPEFPDADPPAQEVTTRRRSVVVSEETTTFVPKRGDDVKVTTKRDKVVTGKIVELSKNEIVLKTPAGDEEDYTMDRIAKIEPLVSGSRADAAEEGPKDPEPGDTVEITTKRGRVVVGVLVELSTEEIVIKNDGGSEDFARDRVESIKVTARASASSGRRAAASSDKGDSDKSDEGKRTRANNGAISVGTRIRELIIEDMGRTWEDVGRILEKEKLDFREGTLKLNYAETHKLLDLLKSAGMLKTK